MRMDRKNIYMDKSKQIKSVPIVKPDDVVPVVRHSNYLSPASGTVWGPRVLLDIELILIVDGQFTYKDIRGVSETFASNDLCLILPGIEHTFSCAASQRKGKPFFACIHLDLLPNKSFLAGDYRLDPLPPLKCRVNNFREVNEFFKQMDAVYNSSDKYRDELVFLTAKLIWLYLSRQWTASDSEQLSPTMQEMTAFLNERFMYSVGRRDLAKKFGVTPQYVNRLFQRELKMTPTEYLNRYRVMQAAEYLRHGGMKVSDAAVLVGFDDPFYFSRIFKRYMGLTALSFIKKHEKWC